ncbi:MAG: hypothetical protein H7Y86_08465 [Rhizobacter sp.]|nr:hypothetical protein [Ferruginibacter sp.]
MFKEIFKLIIIAGFATLLSWKCSPNSTVLTFENKSGLHIDSVLFTINNASYKIRKIGPNTTIRERVTFDTIKLNNHDVMVMAKIFLKDSFFRGGFHYNDLYGGLDDEYILTLKEDSTTTLDSK